MQNTDNFNLKLYEGEDLFNPLVVENVNVQAIDTQMKKNENHTVGDATELVSGTVHALTRLTPDTPMLRFTATSRFAAGDTFTVDGVQVSALTVSGEQLPVGAYIIGSGVLAYLKGTLLTFFTSQGTLATAQNALKLGGNLPEYYGTSTAVQQAQDTATAAGNLANEVNSNLSNIGNFKVIKSIPLSEIDETFEVDDMSVFREIKLIIFYGSTGKTYPMAECTVPYDIFKIGGGIMCRLITSTQSNEYARVIYNSDTSITCRGCNTTNKCAVYGIY